MSRNVPSHLTPLAEHATSTHEIPTMDSIFMADFLGLQRTLDSMVLRGTILFDD